MRRRGDKETRERDVEVLILDAVVTWERFVVRGAEEEAQPKGDEAGLDEG